MCSSSSPDLTSDDRLEEILHEYLQAVDAGTPLDREELLRRHPERAAELAAFLDGQEQVARLADAMGESARPLSFDPGVPTMDLDAASKPAPGTQIGYFGDYELIEEIARGGMGVVYKARQVSLNRVVALKMILSGRFASASDVRRFRAEAEAAANLDHPHIVPIYEVGQHEGQQYFSMKYVEGGSLVEHLARFRADPVAAARLIQKAARAVHHAHQHGILHRDLKPANILLDANQEPVVTDFGLAKRLESINDLTHSGAIVGTPGYMAPEQARAEKGLSTAVDVYGLGAILYELLTGRPPFQGSTPLETVRLVLESEPSPPHILNATVDAELATICLKCLEKTPADRYPSTEALADDLGRWLDGEPIAARPCSRWQRIRKYARRKPAIATLIAVSTLALIAFIGTLAISNILIARKEAQTSAAFQAERRTSYVQRVGRAYSEWQAGDMGTADRLLADCPADLRGWEWHYLEHLCNAEQRTFTGHAARVRGIVWPVTRIAFDPTGRRVASLDRGGTVHVWNPDTGASLVSFSVDGDNIDAAAFSRDLTRLAYVPLLPTDETGTGKTDVNDLRRTIQVWDLTTGRRLTQIKAPESLYWQFHVPFLAFSPDGQRIASSRPVNEQNVAIEEVKIWDVATGRAIQTIGAGAGHRTALCPVFSPDGTRIATGDHDWGGRQPAVRVWDVQTGKLVLTLPVDRSVLAVAYSPDGKRIAASCGATLRVWDSATGREVRTLPGAGSSIAFSPDSSRIASSGPGASAIIWDIASGEAQVKLRGLHGGLVFSPDGRRLATASDGSLIRLWDAHSDPEVRLLCHDERARHRYLRMAWSRDSEQVAVAGLVFDVPTPGGGNRSLWGVSGFQPGTGQEVFRLLSSKDSQGFACEGAAFSPRGDRLAVLTQGRKENHQDEHYRVSIYQTPGLKPVHQFERGSASSLPLDVSSIAHAREGRLMLELVSSPDRTQTVEVCDEITGEPIFVVRDTGCHPAVSGDGQRLATRDSFNRVQLWDTADGKKLAEIRGDGGNRNIRAIAMNADGRRLALVSDEGLSVHDVDAGDAREVFRSTVACAVAAFTPDGRCLATGSSAGVITIWHAESGQEVLALHGHDGAIHGLSFSPDGRFLASAAADGSVKLWEAARRPQ